MKRRKHNKNLGFSIMELLAVVTVLGIIVAIILPRVTSSGDSAKQKLRDHHAVMINSAVERWYIDNNSWPADNLSDIGASTAYFPEGLPSNPIEGGTYALNTTTKRVDMTGWANH